MSKYEQKINEIGETVARLDERTIHISDLTEKQEKHLSALNDKVSNNMLNIVATTNRVSNLEAGIPIKFNKKQVATGGASLITFLTLLLMALGKALGWF